MVRKGNVMLMEDGLGASHRDICRRMHENVYIKAATGTPVIVYDCKIVYFYVSWTKFNGANYNPLLNGI